MTERTLRTLRFHPQLSTALERTPEPLAIAAIRPNGLLAGAVPTGVPQHELARPHFAFDQPIEFADIKAGEDNIWFQRKAIPPLWDTSEPLAYFGGAAIRGVTKSEDNRGYWEIEYDVGSEEAFYTFRESVWQAYRRYLWVPIGWGTEDGYPLRENRRAFYQGHVGNLRKVFRAGAMIGNTPSTTSTVCQITEEFLEAFPADPGPDVLEFVLHPKWVDSSFDGQGDRIPDMPNQQPQGGNGDQGDGEGQGQPDQQPGEGDEQEGPAGGDGTPKEDEIPPMPGEGDYTGIANKYDYHRQAGWWGSETGA